jgi:hypothetical protein
VLLGLYATGQHTHPACCTDAELVRKGAQVLEDLQQAAVWQVAQHSLMVHAALLLLLTVAAGLLSDLLLHSHGEAVNGGRRGCFVAPGARICGLWSACCLMRWVQGWPGEDPTAAAETREQSKLHLQQ